MGKNALKILKEDDIASIGIGAMIVFIAMVLVAGIAASVLIQTATDLEMQALKTGEETIEQVAAGVKITAIEAHNTSGKIDQLAIEIASLSGSPDIDLSQVVIEISDSTNKYILRFGNRVTLNGNINGSIFTDDGDETVWSTSSATAFNVIVLQDADDSCTNSTPIINFGDHVALTIDADGVFTSTSGIDPRQDVFGMVIPEEGAPGIIGFTTPSAYTEAVIDLQ
jgi:flagellin FlaB